MPFWCEASSKDPLLLLSNVDFFSSFSRKKLSPPFSLIYLFLFLIPGLNSLICCMQQ